MIIGKQELMEKKMKLTTPTTINVKDLVGNLNGVLGLQFPNTFYGEATRSVESPELISRLPVVVVGQLEKLADSASRCEIAVKYVIIVNDPSYQQTHHAPYGVYDLMGLDFEVYGDRITPEVIEQAQRPLGLTPVSR